MAPAGGWDFATGELDPMLEQAGLALTRDNSTTGGVVAELAFTWEQEGFLYVILDDALIARDIVSDPFFELLEVAPFPGYPIAMVGTAPILPAARERFSRLAIQEDCSPPLELLDDTATVASADGVLAECTGVAALPSGRAWSLSSSAGPTGPGGSVVIGDIPSPTGLPGGPVADFFAAPVNMIGQSVSLSLRQLAPSATPSTESFRVLLVDADQNEAATLPLPLTGDFEDWELEVPGGFTMLVDSERFDFERVSRLSVEFLSELAPAPALEFQIRLVPEPQSFLAGVAAILTVLGLRRSTRRS